jgi:hypothetical protein
MIFQKPKSKKSVVFPEIRPASESELSDGRGD